MNAIISPHVLTIHLPYRHHLLMVASGPHAKTIMIHPSKNNCTPATRFWTVSYCCLTRETAVLLDHIFGSDKPRPVSRKLIEILSHRFHRSLSTAGLNGRCMKLFCHRCDVSTDTKIESCTPTSYIPIIPTIPIQ